MIIQSILSNSEEKYRFALRKKVEHFVFDFKDEFSQTDCDSRSILFNQKERQKREKDKG